MAAEPGRFNFIVKDINVVVFGFAKVGFTEVGFHKQAIGKVGVGKFGAGESAASEINVMRFAVF